MNARDAHQEAVRLARVGDGVGALKILDSALWDVRTKCDTSIEIAYLCKTAAVVCEQLNDIRSSVKYLQEAVSVASDDAHLRLALFLALSKAGDSSSAADAKAEFLRLADPVADRDLIDVVSKE